MPPRRGRSPVPERRDRCSVQGCRSTLGYKTENGVRKMSTFCKDHTCHANGRDKIGGGNFCVYPKDPSAGVKVKYCDTHRACGAEECLESGENNKHVLPWFCQRHQCDFPKCIKGRFGTLRYCEEHIPTCDLRGCPNRADQGRFCHNHTCRIPECPRVAPQYQLCDVHYPCGVPDCTRFRRSTVHFCEHHTCDVPRCYQRAESGSRCRLHLPCPSEDCDRLRAPGKAFCARHNCEIAGCLHEQVARHRCADHLPCGTTGCGRFQTRDRFGEGMAGYCEKHLPCLKEGCREPIESEGEDFCKGHKCRISRCSSERHGRSWFCDNHTCHVNSCVQPLYDLESHDARFCQLHKCIDERCADRARAMPGYCNLHGCTILECPEARSPQSQFFCDGHRCKVSGCSAEGVSRGQFCLANRHACIEPGCRARRLEEENAMGFCLDHFGRHAGQHAASEVQSGYEDRIRQQEAENERLRRLAEMQQRDREAEAAALRRERERQQEARDRERRDEEARARARAADRIARDNMLRREAERRRRQEAEQARRRQEAEQERIYYDWDDDEWDGGWR